MRYKKLIEEVARLSSQPEEAVRAVLFSFSDALVQLDEKDMVRTPLGAFRLHRRKSREVVLPDGDGEASIGEELVVKLRPGTRLRKEAD